MLKLMLYGILVTVFAYTRDTRNRVLQYADVKGHYVLFYILDNVFLITISKFHEGIIYDLQREGE